MIKSSIENLSKEIGYDIGMSDDVTQANLLNGFCEALANSMDDNKLQMQVCYLVDKLSDKSIKVLEEIHEFIILKQK